MTERTDHTIQALRSGHDTLAARVRGFSPADLSRPSGASEWQVSQVLSHLGSGAEIGLATLEGALDGTGRRDGDFNKEVWARWDAMSPEVHAASFLAADEALVRRYESLEAKTREELRVDLGWMPAPVDVGTLGGLRLNEYAHHAWDVAVSFDPAAALAPEATELLLDSVAPLIGFLGKPQALDGRRASLAIRLSAPERSLGLDLGDAVTLTDEPAQPDGVLTAPAEWWLRLLTGRHAPEHTPAGVELTGDVVTLDDLRRVFPGF